MYHRHSDGAGGRITHGSCRPHPYWGTAVHLPPCEEGSIPPKPIEYQRRWNRWMDPPTLGGPQMLGEQEEQLSRLSTHDRYDAQSRAASQENGGKMQVSVHRECHHQGCWQGHNQNVYPRSEDPHLVTIRFWLGVCDQFWCTASSKDLLVRLMACSRNR